jgi:hypothetical protein
MLHRAEPILKGRVIETLSTRFDSQVEMAEFHVSVLKGLEVSGDGLRIYPPDDVMAAGAKNPLIELGHFSFHADVRGLFLKPMHVGTVHVSRMAIHIPPREVRTQVPKTDRRIGKIKIVVDEIVCDDSKLVIETAKPDKDPKEFDLKHIAVQRVRRFLALRCNAGQCHSDGRYPCDWHLWPWVNESPGTRR